MTVVDIDVVTDAIRAAALCAMCLTREASASLLSVLSALAWIGRRVTTEMGRCEACLMETVVYRLSGQKGWNGADHTSSTI